MRRILLLLILTISSTFTFGQSLDELDSYTVDEFYKKVELDYGTLDEDGDDIDYIYVKTKVDTGIYEIQLTDGDGDLYEVKGTNLYITFRGYFGYAGYSQECYLEVGNYSSTVYKRED